MAGTPGPGMSQHPGFTARQQQQDYMTQFNNSQYAAIPGVRGQQPIPPTPVGGITGQPVIPGYTPSGWHPPAGATTNLLSGIRSDYMNGTFSNADWQGLLPQQPGNGMAQNHMVRPQPPAAMSGQYGQQAALLAGLLGQQGGASSYGGLLGGPKGRRIPGGK